MIPLRHLTTVLLAVPARAITVAVPPDMANSDAGTVYPLENGVATTPASSRYP